MAKVMVSFPDDKLAALDGEARRRGLTRSGLLQSLADDAIRERARTRAARVERVMADATAHDGKGVEHLKRLRPQ